MATPNRYMTPKQAADFLGMSVRWLYDRTKDGTGPVCRRRGRRILFLRIDVERWDASTLSRGRDNKTSLPAKHVNSVSSHVA